MLAHPHTRQDVSQFRDRAARCLEQEYDRMAKDLMTLYPENAALTTAYALQQSEFRDFDLGKLVGWLKELPYAVEC